MRMSGLQFWTAPMYGARGAIYYGDYIVGVPAYRMEVRQYAV